MSKRPPAMLGVRQSVVVALPRRTTVAAGVVFSSMLVVVEATVVSVATVSMAKLMAEAVMVIVPSMNTVRGEEDNPLARVDVVIPVTGEMEQRQPHRGGHEQKENAVRQLPRTAEPQ